MDPQVEAVLDVLAPYRQYGTGDDAERSRTPIFEWPHETTPTDEEMADLAREIVAKLRPVQTDQSGMNG